MTDRDAMADRLTRLRDALNEADDIAVRLTTAVAVPFLDVTSRAFPGIGERIKCRPRQDGGWEFAWGWGPVIGDADDVEGAAIAVRTALRPLCGAPANGGES